jgi:hypothetical protein
VPRTLLVRLVSDLSIVRTTRGNRLRTRCSCDILPAPFPSVFPLCPFVVLMLPSDFRWFTLRYRQERLGFALELDPLIRIDLPEALLDLAELTRLGLSSGLFVEASESPGYLKGLCNGWTVLVPWPLAPFFPSLEILSELLKLAEGTSIPSVPSVCVSGSGAIMGAGLPIGDIDFCQYVPLAPRELVPSIEDFFAEDDDRILVSASYGKRGNATKARPPFSLSWPSVKEKMEACSSLAGAERCMLDFVGKVPSLGLSPVSNVVLPSDFKDRAIGAATDSFVYQEAVAVRSSGVDVPLWTLADADQLGEYLDFLEKQIDEWIEKKPLKAIKRAFSLTRLMQLDDLANEAHDILVSPESVNFVFMSKQVELSTIAKKCDSVRLASWVRDISPAVAEVGLELPEDVTDKCKDFVRRLRSQMSLLDEELTA